MNVKTGLQAGMGEEPSADDEFGAPYMNTWMSCWRCKGKKDQYGNVSQATCGACWPVGEQAPM